MDTHRCKICNFDGMKDKLCSVIYKLQVVLTVEKYREEESLVGMDSCRSPLCVAGSIRPR
jgi:hypothetical protein